jgi:hypothetical protein
MYLNVGKRLFIQALAKALLPLVVIFGPCEFLTGDRGPDAIQVVHDLTLGYMKARMLL